MVLVSKAKPTATIHHKKRAGRHHQQGKNYSKPYWPYLPLLAIVGIGIIANGIWAQKSTNVLGYATDVSATQLLADTNQQRNADHEAGLQLNNKLSAAAQAKANDMVRRNYWAHNTPDGYAPWTFISQAGYRFTSTGENLAYGFNDSSALVNGWMNSVEHRANVLNADYQDVGFGIANASNFQSSGTETVVVAMYGKPVTASVATASAPTTSPTASADTVQPMAKRIARMQLLNPDSSQLTVLIVSAVTAITAAWFVLRHGLLWRRVLVRSETFIVRHRLLDIIIVSATMLGFILTRTAGMIH
jgi:hypothetical protein